jgi:hypothetical protein
MGGREKQLEQNPLAAVKDKVVESTEKVKGAVVVK